MDSKVVKVIPFDLGIDEINAVASLIIPLVDVSTLSIDFEAIVHTAFAVVPYIPIDSAYDADVFNVFVDGSYHPDIDGIRSSWAFAVVSENGQ
eukprot:33487-Karenia_brevis.AAC.1